MKMESQVFILSWSKWVVLVQKAPAENSLRLDLQVITKRATQVGELFQCIIKFLMEVWLTGEPDS